VWCEDHKHYGEKITAINEAQSYNLRLMKKETPSMILILQEQIAQQNQQNKMLSEQNQNLINQLEQQNLLIAKLQQQLDTLLRTLYGKKSERKQKEPKGEQQNGEQKTKTSRQPNDNKNQPKRQPLPESLERVKIKYELAESERICKLCGNVCHCIGKDVSEQLEYIPGRLYVKQHVRYKYGCRLGCEMKVAPMPLQPIPKGIPGPGLLAEILINKYQDSMPLYRQALRMQRHHIDIPESTLCDWVARSSSLLERLIPLMKRDLLRDKRIHLDDTPVPVLAKDKTKKGRLWVYLNNKNAGNNIVFYEYTPNRRKEWPLAFLQGYKGYIQADAYGGHDELFVSGDRIEVGCLAHTRRKFFEVSQTTKDDNQADEALSIIGQIYAHEERVKNLRHQERYYYRKQHSKPIYRRLHRWLRRKSQEVLPKTKLAEAIQYALNHWRALQNVFCDGCLEVDNNAAERAMRIVAIGRKNWLFAGSDEGGKRAAIIYSILETCKQNGLNTFVYLQDVLARLPAQADDALWELLPYHWQPLNKAPQHI
jgi:transposase